MTDIVKGMAREYERAFLSAAGEAHTREDAMRAALLWQAENASEESANGSGPSRVGNKEDLQTVIGGPLHPEFLEWMMGYPTGHTELEASEIASCRKSRKKSAGQS